MKRTVQELALLINGRVVGDETLSITGVASLDNARTGDIVFVENEKYLTRAFACAATAVIVPAQINTSEKTLILVDHPKLAFARIVGEFAPHPTHHASIHPTAIVSETAQLGREVSIGAYVTIGAGTMIGDNTVIGNGCVIGDDVKIGAHCHLYARVVVYDRVHIHNRVIVHAGAVLGSDGFGYVRAGGQYHKFPQIGSLIIEEDVEIGSNTTVDRGTLDATVIGRGSKIDNLVQIAHNVRIGEHCVLAAQVGVSGSSIIEDNAVLGGQVGVADHVRIEAGAIVGAQAGIPTGKIIRRGLTVWGTPARQIDEFKRIYALTQQLPTLKERLRELEQQLAQPIEKNPEAPDEKK
ncbi:MAG: UDP-3-O-(3-hydroxymyristoyl)glucosamine N-acyltransferase [Acidobacteriota bacterium]